MARSLLPRRRELLVVLPLTLAFAWTMQGTGASQGSHYALVRSLAEGTATIDRTIGEVGEAATNDFIVVDGHRYSNKPPGLAFAALPVYLVLDAAGAAEPGDPTRALWALGLVSVVLPAAILLLCVFRLVEGVEPGYGALGAAAVGAATLVLPFATVLFSHMLATALLLGAFALLWGERQAGVRSRRVLVAGLLSGLACVVEYQSALVAACLGAYAISRAPRVRRGLSFATAAALGALPVLVYNQWAFGSATQLSYGQRWSDRVSGSQQLVGLPSLSQALELLFSSMGLFVLTPVVACAFAGLVLLFRRGFRAEAITIGGVFGLYFLYNAGYWSPFGGLGPPRFLIPPIAFLAIPLALAFRRFPAATSALGLVSALVMALSTSTYVLASYHADWTARLGDRQVPLTVLSLAGITGWYSIVPFFAAVGAAVLLAARGARTVLPSPTSIAAAGGLVLAWAMLAAFAPQPVEIGGKAGELTAYWSAGLLAAAVVAVAGTHSLRRRAFSRYAPRAT